MVGVEHHDEVRPDGGKPFLLCAEQSGYFAIRAVALHKERKDWCVRYAESGNDIRNGLDSSLLCVYATGWPISSTFTARMRWL